MMTMIMMMAMINIYLDFLKVKQLSKIKRP